MPDPATMRIAATAAQVLGRQLYQRHRLSQRAVDQNAFDAIVDGLARASDELRAAEFRGLPDNEWAAAAECLKDAFERVGELDSRIPLRQAMQPDRLAAWLLSLAPELPASYSLGAAAQGAYQKLAHLACVAVVEFVRRHPEFPLQVEIEQLERLERIEQFVDPTSGAAAFERRYCAAVARQLDKLELFGVTLRDPDFRYPMSTAYISLTVDADGPAPARIEGVLGQRRRILLLGEAGTGKTTLLQRIALWAARDGFPAELADWEGTVPFFLPLRHFRFDATPPGPENFLDRIGSMIRAEQPRGWVPELLRSGRALLLIDGVDELPSDQRAVFALQWLPELLAEYPAARVLVTSRPSALSVQLQPWTGMDALTLLPMTLTDQHAFVAHWHEAAILSGRETAERSAEFQDDLVGKLSGRRHLRRLATNPLLCALICALHSERRMQLPEDRIKLYEAALEMLLVRRDEARGVFTEPYLSIGQREQELLLQKFAYWMIRNGHTEVAWDTAVERLAGYLERSTRPPNHADAVLRHLLARSGILREPSPGRIDFVHRTFQEFLAARQALDDGDLGQLVKRADEDDQWREVFVMSVGLARESERDKLVRNLVKRASSPWRARDELILLAADAIGNAPLLAPDIRGEVAYRASKLLPPQSLADASRLAGVGEAVLDMLPDHPQDVARRDDHILAYMVFLVAEIGGDAALAKLARWSRLGETARRAPSVARAFYDCLEYFPPAEYMRQVLVSVPAPPGHIVAAHTPRAIEALASLPGLPWLSVIGDDESLALAATVPGLRCLIVELPPHPGDIAPIRRIRSLRAVHFVGPDRAVKVIAGPVADIPTEGVHFSILETGRRGELVLTDRFNKVVASLVTSNQMTVARHGLSPQAPSRGPLPRPPTRE
ncbi:NACHT domain-containing protein [Yinghuangia soli]|uniref:NACHT domain-containing protein n=1 Tax=Yinghuangia soli TaxID=2908204 RepID=A0AA41Q3E0_9ACTN|nr:NACHT domain-containing protein [Yinghuangia soli]MCF2529362.1 NACHT domain-containing protein [Yinghuangia soli]